MPRAFKSIFVDLAVDFSSWFIACDLSAYIFIFFLAGIFSHFAAMHRVVRLISGRLAKFALSPGRLASVFHHVR